MRLLTPTRTTTWLLLLIGSLLLPTTSHGFSLSDLFGGGDDEAASTVNNPLTDLISSQLNISNEQAAGGAGALLSIAASQLGGEQATELTKMIPGLDALTDSLPPGTSALLGNMDTINQVFSALGMDASMVSQFIPVVLQFLGDQGASAGLLDSLGSIWQTAG
ncbi:hypothetical protein C9J03_24345 [Photobacterium gaetbulicola]|uniref:DUF2780 domain-containing protein n=1 Tax=Photobacterium gaetbulicola Gung47 TaxID=658445 RepID=A0A0C5WI46_9GAMM|nr:DUF2780 domain-containing protein [Photobacterium gaetbulicola]AJR06788.1 hypothetical protein H744_2c0019 [Photobacterium gaetbulicola Gung47]PSU01491.1 hypothetical protein C9J03_24345 [Photobacterium gaetbulicola]